MWSTIIYSVLLIFATVILLIIAYLKYAFTYWSKKGVPHPKPSIPLGNIQLNFLKYNARITNKIYKEMKKSGAKYCGFYITGKPIFLPLHPEMYKLILSTKFSHFYNRGIYVDEKDPMNSNLFNMDGPTWKKIRQKVTPTFTLEKMKSMLPIVVQCNTDLEDVLQEFCDKSESFNIYDIAGRYSIDVISSCAFGLEARSLKNPNAEFRKYGNKVVNEHYRIALFIALPTLMSLLKLKIFNPESGAFFYKVVKETIEYRQKYNVVRKDFIDILMRLHTNEDNTNKPTKGNEVKAKQTSNETMTLEEIASQAFLFFLAGFETSSTTISFLLYEIAQKPDIQNKMRNEMLSMLKNYNGQITYEGLSKLPYIEKVISETLRKHPPLLMLNRECTEDFQIPGTNIKIDKGTSTIIPTLAIHSDPEFYPNPEKFDPERFSEEEKMKRPPYTYFPFGEGPRNCIGMKFGNMQLKIELIGFLKNFRYTLDAKTPAPLETCSMGNILKPVTPIMIRSEKI